MSGARSKAARVARQAMNVYKGYMPPDLPQHRPRNPIKPWWKIMGRPRLTMYPRQEMEEYSAEPEYPPLNDATPSGLRRQVRLDWYEQLKSLPTIEQKLFEFLRHCNHKIAHINNWLPTNSSLPFIQYLTQTHLIKSLPASYNNIKKEKLGEGDNDSTAVDKQDTLVELVREIVLNQIAFEKYESHKKENASFISRSINDGNRKAYVSNSFIQNLVNQLRKVLVYETNPQLMHYQIDSSPSIRSWWYHSGFEAPNKSFFYRSRKDADGNVNQLYQMDCSSAMNIRSEHLMEPHLNLDDPLVTDISLVQKCNYNPKYYGAFYKFNWPVALPGYWYNETTAFDCPHTSFLSTDCLQLKEAKFRNLASPPDDIEECLNGQAILTAFGWLNSLSMYHGYTPFQEIETPLTCQVITTDGQNWLFNVYQFNAHTFHRDLGGVKRNNICWSTGVLRLYEQFQDGKFIGVNDLVVENIIKFLSKQTNPNYTEQVNYRPYLNVDADQRTDDEKAKQKLLVRRCMEGRKDKWKSMDWEVPLFEHIFFRAKETRHRIRHMKPKWHTPKPSIPKIFG